ncbi:MAG: helix-turn-helix domain-containing protein, partial [Spirochaetaceae bacterium]|nr:helix-turn-helix domain-containing protein [Spirochaetaceae bacterium]
TPNYHDYLEIFYVCSGSGTFRTGNRQLNVEAGDVVVVGNSTFHSLESSVDQAFIIIALYFLPELIYRPGESTVDFDYLIPFYSDDIEFNPRIPSEDKVCACVYERMMAIHHELHARRNYFPAAVKNQICEILLELVRYYRQFSADLQRRGELKRQIDRLNGTLHFLKVHYQKPITLNQIAAVACVSPSYFCKLFKKVTGHSFTDYLRRMRVDSAKDLLLNSDLSISRVGEQVGLENHSYFDRTFRQLTGLSPTEFRAAYNSSQLTLPNDSARAP